MTGGPGSSISPELYPADINPTAAGVGVAGGVVAFEARFLFGVNGAASAFCSGSGTGALFRFRPVFAFLGTSGSGTGSSLTAAVAALKRAERLEDMAYCRVTQKVFSPLNVRSLSVSRIAVVLLRCRGSWIAELNEWSGKNCVLFFGTTKKRRAVVRY